MISSYPERNRVAISFYVQHFFPNAVPRWREFENEGTLL
jgi:hypothetical protein